MSSTEPEKREENLLIGLVMATLAFASLALMGVFAKAAAPGSPAQVNVFFQNAVAFVVLAPFALRHGLKPLKTRRIGMHVLRAFSGSASWLALFIAINLMPLTNAVLLAYSAPIILPLIAWLVTRQRITGPVWIGVVLGFVGIALVLHPSNAELGWGAPIALFGAVMVAMALLSVRWLSETEPDQRIMFFYFSISTLMTLPLALIWWQMPEEWAWPYIIGIGLSLLASQVTIIIAYRYATPVILAPTIYLVIIFTALIDWIVWDRQPTWLEVGGMVLVIVGGIIAMRKGGAAKEAA